MKTSLKKMARVLTLAIVIALVFGLAAMPARTAKASPSSGCTVAVSGDNATKIARRLGCASYTCLGLANPNLVYAGTTYCSGGEAPPPAAPPASQPAAPATNWWSTPPPAPTTPSRASSYSGPPSGSCSGGMVWRYGCNSYGYCGEGYWPDPSCAAQAAPAPATNSWWSTSSSNTSYEYQFASQGELVEYLNSLSSFARQSWEGWGHRVLIGSAAAGGIVMLVKIASSAAVTAGGAWAIIGGVGTLLILAIIEFSLAARGW